MLVRPAAFASLAFALLGGAASARTEPERAVPAIPAAVTFAISGHGWGHGVGLGQYGAYGYAKHGWTYDRILAHYYPGTQLGAAPVSKVRILVGEGKARISITAAAPFSARDATGAVKQFTTGPVAVSVTGKNLVLPVTFLPGAAPLELDGKRYRGSFGISLAGKTLQVVDVVGIDRYLYGVVTSEMDSDWPAEALKTQAVAARSYALANRRSGSFDLFADTRSQAYGGLNAETPSARAAVDATARQVLLYSGKVADTFFSASSGGRTADATEVWSDKPIPYLASVPDPYDTLSPYHNWGPVVVTAEQAGRWLGVAGLQELTPETDGPSGRARTVTASGVLGDVSVEGSAFRRALGLRSTWITIGELALDRPSAPVVYGARARLTGRVRSLPGAVLEQRPLGGSWQAGTVLAPADDGSFVAVATPRVQTEYRLRSGTIVGQAVRFSVAPALTASPTADGTGIAGRVRPAVAGAMVDVQQLTGHTWASAVQAAPDTAGRFSATVAPGDYRIRYAPANGIVPGTSPTVHVG
jgi:stage II sporulation protein D